MLSDEPLSMSTLAMLWSIHLTDTYKALLCSHPSKLLIGEGEVIIGSNVVDDALEALHRDIFDYVGLI